MKTKNIAEIASRNLRADLISAAVEFCGMGEKAAKNATAEALVTRLESEGFSEEGLYESLADEFECGNHGMPQDISELCLPALAQLWIECNRIRAAWNRIDMELARKQSEADAVRKAAKKVSKESRKAAPFTGPDGSWWWSEGVSAAGNRQGVTRVQKSSGESLSSFVRARVSAGMFTLAQIKADAAEAFPEAAKKSTLTTLLADIRNPKYAGKLLAVIDPATGILSWRENAR